MKPRVLIVEDELIIAQDIKGSLELLGCTVVAIFVKGEDAVKNFSSLNPDIVLMDQNLKGSIKGTEAANRIGAISDVPIILLSAYIDRNSVEKEKNIVAIVPKPFNIDDLHRLILETLKDRLQPLGKMQA
jgi:CheY-like chemotaxis protein